MTGAAARPAPEFDPFHGAVGFGVLSGAAAVVLPFLDSLTLALAAIALAAWVGRRPPRAPGARRRPGFRATCGGVCAGVGFVAFWGLSGPWSSVRGLALGLSLVPLWWLHRRSSTAGHGEGTGPG